MDDDRATLEGQAGEIVARLDGVREYAEGYPVEIRRYNGRLTIRAYNEAGCNYTEVDLWDLIGRLSTGDPQGLLGNVQIIDPNRHGSE